MLVTSRKKFVDEISATGEQTHTNFLWHEMIALLCHAVTETKTPLAENSLEMLTKQGQGITS
jgi:hypothetical protein